MFLQFYYKSRTHESLWYNERSNTFVIYRFKKKFENFLNPMQMSTSIKLLISVYVLHFTQSYIEQFAYSRSYPHRVDSILQN